jgi:putative heme-binding domain-containing protein
MNRAGRSDPKLTPLVNRVLGIQSSVPEYDSARVQSLVDAVKAGEGNPENGQAIYLRPQLSCVACHRIGDSGGVIGPALSNVGAGMPLDQIVESVLWPDRQIKEGFQAVTLTMTSGKVITGYLEREGDDMLFYRNTTTPWILPLEQKDIVERQKMPTLMPAGLTNSLTEVEMLDLIAYLASLKG